MDISSESLKGLIETLRSATPARSRVWASKEADILRRIPDVAAAVCDGRMTSRQALRPARTPKGVIGRRG
jgi:hypothetical protein